LRRHLAANRAAVGTFAVFVVMIGIFMTASPRVFLSWPIYNSVLVTLPVALCLVVPLVFVVTVGEIDLSFPATMGFSAWIFALVVHAGYSPFLGILGALVTGMAIGVGVGALVVIANLSSLIATLGMNYMLRGFILIITQGKSIALLDLQGSTAEAVLSDQLFGVPVQIFWALLFVAFAGVLYNAHPFGARVRATGDNPDSAGQMGVNVNRVRIATFVFMGLGAGLAGIFTTMVNFTWWPTTGDGYLLPAIASVFVGGTPTWGGVGTIVGGAIGALIVSFIQSGVVAAGLSGFYVQFFNGLIIVLSLLGHRWNQKRFR
jgi:ribose/xylose/arabinose/galactoside ABC-type transport system permease subunit